MNEACKYCGAAPDEPCAPDCLSSNERRCMTLGCEEPPVSVCFNAPMESPLRVCFAHERELVDRYGFAVVQPRGLGTWPHDLAAAVHYLQTGEYA